MAVSKVEAILNGTKYTLSYNSSSGAYEAEITAPGKSSFTQNGNYYNVTVVAYDDSGNSTSVDASDSTFGNALKLTVKEKVKPTITLTSPTANAVLTNNKPTISWQCKDDDSGINVNTIKLYIDGTEVDGTINAVKSGLNYTCSYVPPTSLSDGAHTLKFVCSDNDGNNAETSISVKIDTVPPTLNVSAPTNNLHTNETPITVSGYTNDATSSPVTVTINGKTVTVDSNGYFNTTVSLELGENTITVIAKDGAGKTTTVTRTVYYNNIPPTINSISIVPNPVDAGKTFKITVKVTDS